MNRKNFRLLFFFFVFSSLAHAQTSFLELNAGFYRIEAEVAADPQTRQRGLMHRRQMPANRGMLFVFTEAGKHCMWMRNTFIPLSVAFLDEDATIINIEDMRAQTDDNHCAVRPARYALEMNLGWFSGKYIRAGTRIGGLEKAPRVR
ncbi:MAG: DUF192 domain-containing protein [Candidatus Accumulibacter sp.]|nr:DUF192 domain-containing protein [Accumulibacter sp.]